LYNRYYPDTQGVVAAANVNVMGVPTVRALRSAWRVVLLVAAMGTLLAMAMPAGAATTVATTGTVTATAGSTVALPGWRVRGATGANVLVTISTSAGSLKLGSVTGMTAATGYTLPAASATFTTLSMWGTPANANASLATLSLVAPGSGTATISVNSSNYDSNVTYNATNGHYYKYVAATGTTWSTAKAAAEGSTYLGKSGYLATITTSAEDTFVQNNTVGTNIWIGHTDSTLEGRWQLANSSGMPTAEKDQWFWRASCVASNGLSTTCSNTALYSSTGTTITYANWCNMEPNNSDGSSGEDVAVTKWNGGTCWNDLRDGNTSQVNGYMVEYGDDAAFVDASSASASQTVNVSASAPSITAGTATTVRGTSTLTGWTIANMAASTNVLATLSTSSGTLALTTTTGLTRAPGYTATSWTAFSQLAFSGTVASINTALGTLALTATHAATPTITLAVTPTTDATATYDFTAAHYYTRSDVALSLSSAQTETEAATLRGKAGYLAAVTTSAENAFVESFVGGNQNLWGNGTDIVTNGTWKLFSQPGMPTAEKGATMTFFDWCASQPDAYFGEEYIQFNYAGGACWNDTDAANPHPNWSAANPAGYVVEYGDDTAYAHASSPTASQSVTVDATAPTVSSFSSTTAAGGYRAGDTINVTATMSEAVQALNSFTVTLNSGATVTLTAATAGTTLTGTYTVAAGQTSAGLTVSSFTAGTVADAAGNALTSTTLPATNIATATAIVVDAVVPSVSSFTSATSTPMYPGTITYTLTFSEAVTGVAAGDFTNTGTAQNCAFAPGTDTGTSRTVTITGCGAGTVIPRFALGGASDAVGNTGPATAATSGTTITITDPAPGAPTNPTATPGNTTVTVDWVAPAATGSSAIVDYTVTASPGGATCTATAPAVQCTVTGLTNGTAYTFTVAARNASVTGPASSSVTATPYGVYLPTDPISLFTTAYRSLSTFMPSGEVPRIIGFSGSLRATITATNATVKVTTTTGLTAVTGYASANWTAGAAELAFDGTQAQLNAALATLAAQGTSVGSTPTIAVAITPAGAAYSPTTGHYYELVASNVTWRQARCLAKYSNATYSSGAYNASTGNCTASGALVRRTSNGLNGYLATVTSAEENQFITTKIGNSSAWIGGSDIAAEGSWRWMDGPEAGLRYFIDGTCSDGLSGDCASADAGARYNFWNSGEPNDSSSNEDAVQILSGGTGRWNDLPSDSGTLYYVVEYGDDGGTEPARGSATATGTNVDTLTLATGTLVGTHAVGGTTLTYGIQTGVDGGTTVSRTGTYGTLVVTKATGAYTYTPNATAISALSAGTSETHTVTVTDGSLTRTAVFTVSLTAANDLPVVTPVTISLTDTAASDTFSPSFGTFAATDAESNAISSWSMTGATTGSWLLAWSSGSITFNRQLVDTYGTLYVRSSDGAYRFEPNATAVNGASSNVTDTFPITPTDSASSVGAGTLTVSIVAVNDRPIVTVTVSNLTDVTDGLANSAYALHHSSAGTGSTPGGEEVYRAFDGLTSTKYVNFSGAGSGATIDLGSPYAVNGLGLTTANDEIARDPASYQVYGSSNGTAFTLVSSGSLAPPTGRATAYPDVSFANAIAYRWYRVVFPTIRGGGADSIFQVAEIRLPGSSGGQLTYVEGAAAGTVLTGIDVTDPDTATLAGATVSITAGFTAGDELAFANDGSTMGSISGTYNAGTGVLTLTGTGTPTQYQSALRAVTYRSTSSLPTATSTSRTISWQVDDGQASANLSTSRTSTVGVVEQNQTPVPTIPATASFTDTSAADSFADATGTLAATDADGDAVTFGIGSGTAGSTTIGGVTYTVSRTGTFGTLYVRGATGAYRFVPNAPAINARATSTSETYSVTASDGAATGSATLTVSITAADDVPTLGTPTAVTLTDTTGNDSFSAASGTLAGVDAEGGALTYGISGGVDGGALVSFVGGYGTLTVTKATGAYTYTPSAAAINGRTANDAESFTVTTTDGAASATATFAVQIVGSPEAPAITWATPAAITYPAGISASTQLNATATDATTSAAVTGTYAYSIGGVPVADGDQFDAGTHTLHVEFTPTGSGAGDYVTTSRNVTLTVNRAAQTITAIPSVTSLDYGASATLSAGGHAGNGTISYARVSGPCTVTGANVATTGVGACVVTASIAQSTNHLAATSSPVTITVDPATLTVTAQSVSKRQTTADPTFTALITGYVGADGVGVLTSPVTFSRAPGEAPGTYAITPSGAAAANYVFSYVPGVLTITDRDVPIITWATPAPITYGDTLTSSDLNATAAFGGSPVAGTFAYSIGGTSVGAGSVVPAGNPVLTATFTPTDTVTYATGTTAQVTMTVARRQLTVTGITAADRLYDGTRTAVLTTSGAALVGVVGGDPVTLDAANALGTFDTADPGTGKTVTVSGLALAGAAQANYAVAQPSTTATITATAPGAATSINATVTSGQAVVTWSAPTFTGGLPITGYVVTASPGGQTCTWTSGPLTCTITGLANGTAYTFSVVASNAMGSGSGSSPTSPVTPTPEAAVVPVQSDAPPAVSKDGSVGVRVGCAATARACSASVSMYKGEVVIALKKETIDAGTVEQIALALPIKLQKQLAEEGVIEVRVVTLVDIDGSTVRVESTMRLEAPPADLISQTTVRPAADGSATMTAECVGTIVSRCDGTIQLFAEGATIAPRAGRAATRIVIGEGRIVGPAGRKLMVRAALTGPGRKALRRHTSMRVTPVATFKGDTRLAKPLPSFVVVLMTPQQWFRRSLATLFVGGYPRLELNDLLVYVREGSMSRTAAARRIEREIIPAREQARMRVAALPIPPQRYAPIARLLLRAFDQSLAANRAYVTWLRSGQPESSAGWAASRRASATKARLIALMQREGARYGIDVPSATNSWP
jgi:hypothetical protein